MRQQRGQEMVLLKNAFQVTVMAYESGGPLPRLPKLPEIITWSTSLKHKFFALLRSDESEFQGGLAICILSKL